MHHPKLTIKNIAQLFKLDVVLKSMFYLGKFAHKVFYYSKVRGAFCGGGGEAEGGRGGGGVQKLPCKYTAPEAATSGLTSAI